MKLLLLQAKSKIGGGPNTALQPIRVSLRCTRGAEPRAVSLFEKRIPTLTIESYA